MAARAKPALLVLLLIWAAHASPAARADAKPSDSPPPAAPCLGDDSGRKGVQEKTFLKQRRFELVAEGGLFASDLLSSSYLYGGTLAFYPTEDFGIEATFAVTPIALEVDESLSQFFGDTRFRTGTGYLALASALWSPLHFKVRTAGGGILHGDGALLVGGGKLFNETAQGIAFQGGGVLELYLTRWLSLRLDLRDVVLLQEVVAETRITNNVTILAGLGLWFPFGF